jgi:hypothetical protein
VLCAASPPSAESSVVSDDVGTVVDLHLHEVAPGVGL